MTTHDRDKAIALREEADKFATKELQCEGEYHPDFHTVSDERFAAIMLEKGRQAERKECGKFADTEFEMVQLRNALTEIAGSKSLTATPTQFYRYLQRLASDALTSHAKREKAIIIRARSTK